MGKYPDVGVQLPHFPPLWREGRAGVEAAALFRSSVWRGGGVPAGDGRPVLLIPGFMAGDGSLGTMTRWLRENGYYTRRAGIRLNVGCSTEACARLEEKIERFASDAGERVAIIGQSRGGVFARALAVRRPDLVSGIVTLGSPTVNQLRAHPFVLAQVAVVGALGSGRVPGMFRMSCLRGACCSEFRARPRRRRSRPRSASPRCTRAPTGSSTGTPAWTRRPSRSRSARRTSGWALNAEVYAEVGHALGAFAEDWPQAA